MDKPQFYALNTQTIIKWNTGVKIMFITYSFLSKNTVQLSYVPLYQEIAYDYNFKSSIDK